MRNLSEPLNDAEMDRLDAFLLERVPEDFDDETGDGGVLNLSELDGLLTAVVSGPVLVPTSQWLAAVWGDCTPVWRRADDFEEILALIFRHMNGIAATLMEAPDDFEPLFMERRLDEFTVLIVDAWCEGYMRGVALTAENWAEGGEEVDAMLEPIRAFTQAAGWPAHEIESAEEVERLQNAVTLSARAIHAHWLARREEGIAVQPVRRAGPRVGRNDPCPCGSGRKYKRCCLH